MQSSKYEVLFNFLFLNSNAGFTFIAFATTMMQVMVVVRNLLKCNNISVTLLKFKAHGLISN